MGGEKAREARVRLRVVSAEGWKEKTVVGERDGMATRAEEVAEEAKATQRARGNEKCLAATSNAPKAEGDGR